MHQSGGLIRKVWAMFTKKASNGRFFRFFLKSTQAKRFQDWSIGRRELSLNMGDRLAARRIDFIILKSKALQSI